MFPLQCSADNIMRSIHHLFQDSQTFPLARVYYREILAEFGDSKFACGSAREARPQGRVYAAMQEERTPQCKVYAAMQEKDFPQCRVYI